MFRFAVVLAVIGCAVAGTIPEGLIPQLDGRIVGGSAASIQSYPYQCSLEKNGAHFCGGTIIKADTVVTAAHCLQNVSPSQLTVRAGSSIRGSGGVVVRVASFKNHPNYNANTMVNDVAVIKLASPLPLSATVKTLGMATSAPATGTNAVCTGWGTTSEGAYTLPSQLQAVALKIVKVNDCKNYSYAASQIQNSMICAYSAGKDACQGDSGGPLMANNQLVGVVSWGYGCARPSYPGVYADVAHLRNWITSV